MTRDQIGRGIALGALGYTLFALHDAATKWLVAAIPVWQILFFRSVLIVLGCSAIGRRALWRRVLMSPHRGPLTLRAALVLIAWLAYYTAAKTLPLAQLLTLYFGAPVVTTLLAMPLLGERVSGARWISVLLGFAGVLVAAEPARIHASRATGLVLVAAVIWAYTVILMRQIAQRESSIVQVLAQNLFYLIVTGGLSLATWVPPHGLQWPLLLLVGVLGGGGQFFLIEGARFSPAAIMATVEYTSLIWAFVLGFWVFGDVPRRPVWIGAGLILLSGLLMLWRERRRVFRED